MVDSVRFPATAIWPVRLCENNCLCECVYTFRHVCPHCLPLRLLRERDRRRCHLQLILRIRKSPSKLGNELIRDKGRLRKTEQATCDTFLCYLISCRNCFIKCKSDLHEIMRRKVYCNKPHLAARTVMRFVCHVFKQKKKTIMTTNFVDIMASLSKFNCTSISYEVGET
jgi:hypothetical protein